MTQTTSAIHYPPVGDPVKAHADATAAITRAGDEVTRLTKLLEEAAVAVAKAEQRAADAVAGTVIVSGGDDQVMQAVATCKARRDAVATALERAKATFAAAKARLPRIEQQIRREDAERTIHEILPMLSEMQRAADDLGSKMASFEVKYDNAMREFLATFTFPKDSTPGGAPPHLIEERVRSVLFTHLKRVPFVQGGGMVPFGSTPPFAELAASTERFLTVLIEQEAQTAA